MQNQIKPLQNRVFAELNYILGKKAEKSYRRSPVWLLVRNMFPLWNSHDFEQYMDEIVVPKGHPFQHVFLLGESSGGLVQLR